MISKSYFTFVAMLCVLSGVFCVFTHWRFSVDRRNEIVFPVSRSWPNEDVLHLSTATEPAGFAPLQPVAAIFKGDGHEKLNKRYMLALHYAEQLTMSLMQFHSFLNLAYDMNMTGVEPLIYNSRMYSVSNLNFTGRWYNYNTLFNVSAINERLKVCQGKRTNRVTIDKRNVFESNQEFSAILITRSYLYTL